MKQVLQNYRNGKLVVADIPSPSVRPGFVVVQNYYSVVSVGTERHAVDLARKSLLQKARARPDLVRKVIARASTDGILSAYKTAMNRLDDWQPMGYSSTGRVTDVGEGINDIHVGDLVACAGAGYANHAEIIAVPRNLLTPLPDSLDLKFAAFTTIGAIALQGIRRASLNCGESVAVIGLGLIGQLTIAILRSYGFSVLGLDINATQVEKVRALGCTAAVIGKDDVLGVARGLSNGIGVDAVIVTAATASSEPVSLAGEISRNRGRVSAVGLVGMEIPRRLYYEKELDFLVSRSYGPGRYDSEYEEEGKDYPAAYVRWTENRNMSEFVRLLQSGMDISSLITKIVPIEEAPAIYKSISEAKQESPILAVLFEYPKLILGNSAFIRTTKTSAARLKEGLNIGVIGVGSFAREILLPSLKKMEGIKIRGLCTITGRAARVEADRCGAEYCTSDSKVILDDEEIDMVVIATRHDLHASLIVEALEHGKDVFVEKPPALTSVELKKVMNAAQKSENRVMVGYNRRFSVDMVKTKHYIEKTSFPIIVNYRVNAGYIPQDHWVHNEGQGGGRIVGEVCHFVDSLQFLTDSTPISVYAHNVEGFPDAKLQDNFSALISFRNGSVGTITYTALGGRAQGKESIEVFAGGKSVLIDNFRATFLYGESKVKRFKHWNQDKGHQSELEAMVSAIKKGSAAPISLEQIAATSLTTFAIKKSLEIRQSVNVDLTGF